MSMLRLSQFLICWQHRSSWYCRTYHVSIKVDQTYVNNLYFDRRETILQIIDCCMSISRLTGHIHLFNEGTRDRPSTAVHTVVTPGQYEVCAEYGHVHHFQVDLRNKE